MGNADLGVLVRNGPSCTLTYTRHLAHPPEKVWRAVTESDHVVARAHSASFRQVMGRREVRPPL